MFVTTESMVGDFISPFGARFSIPAGRVTELPVEQGYWLLDQPAVNVKFKDAEEEAACTELRTLTQHNPMRGLPVPQYMKPNATLKVDGRSTRFPVIVVNPVALFAENQTYDFTPPAVTMVADKAMLKALVAEVLAEVAEPVTKAKGKAKGKTTPDPEADTLDI